MNQLGYGADLSDDLLLGHIAWYTVMDPKITHDRLTTLVGEAGLNARLLPRPPRLGDAFKRACRYSERTNVPIPNSAHTANFLIRKVTQNTEEVVRHMVMEVVDQSGKRLEHHTVAQMTFKRKDNVFKVRQLSLNPDYDQIIRESLQIFSDRFDEATKTIDPQVLRYMIRQQLDDVAAIPVRRQGSVYFIPIIRKSTVDSLGTFFEGLGGGSSFHALPLVDTTKQQEMIKSAFEEEIHELAVGLMSDVNAARTSGRKVTPKAFEELKRRHNAITSQFREYSELIDEEMGKAQIEVEALSRNFSELLMSEAV